MLAFRNYIVVFIVLISQIGVPAMSSETFVVRLDNGSTLFDETDVEQYKAKSNTFVINKDASKRLFSNFEEVSKDAEHVQPHGTYFEAANKDSPFEAMLGDKNIASGNVPSIMSMYAAKISHVFLFASMPIIQDGRVNLSIGKVIGDTKYFAEGEQEATFSPILGEDVAKHFEGLKKLAP